MSDEKKPEVRHVFDGIEELDNRLPNWWLGILWITIVFSAGYWFYYHTTSIGPSQAEELKQELAAIEAKKPKEVALSDDLLASMAQDAQVVETGKQVFVQTCVACHAAQGEGLVGPNLTDNAWIHGSQPMAIYKGISEGYTAKGMPPWGPTLGEERTRAVTAYVLTLKGKNLPGKPPEGQTGM